jgi:hypothetical protein
MMSMQGQNKGSVHPPNCRPPPHFLIRQPPPLFPQIKPTHAHPPPPLLRLQLAVAGPAQLHTKTLGVMHPGRRRRRCTEGAGPLRRHAWSPPLEPDGQAQTRGLRGLGAEEGKEDIILPRLPTTPGLRRRQAGRQAGRQRVFVSRELSSRLTLINVSREPSSRLTLINVRYSTGDAAGATLPTHLQAHLHAALEHHEPLGRVVSCLLSP